MPQLGKYCGPKPTAKDCTPQKMGKNTFNSPKARPSPPKSHTNPKVPNSKVGVYK